MMDDCEVVTLPQVGVVFGKLNQCLVLKSEESCAGPSVFSVFVFTLVPLGSFLQRVCALHSPPLITAHQTAP